MFFTYVNDDRVKDIQQYGGNYPLASKGVALSTVISVFTIPLVVLIVQ
jgi:predicted permease